MSLDVVIVTWNRKEDLTRCLDSIRAQSLPPQRVIVVDNGSEDGTREVIPKEYPEVIFLPQTGNLGACTGRNIGMEKVRADLVFFLDDDTELLPGCIEEIVRRFNESPSLGAIQPEIILPHQDPLNHPPRNSIPNPHPISAAWCIRTEALPENPWPGHFVRQGEEMWVALHLYDRGYRSEVWLPAKCLHFQSQGGQRERVFFFFTRNSFLLYCQRFPMLLAFPMAGYKILRTLINVRSLSDLRAWFRGIGSGLKMIFTGVAKRDPIRWKAVVRYLKEVQEVRKH